MQIIELKDALAAFNQTGTVMVSVPQIGKPNEQRAIRIVGHLDHPGQVMNAPDHPGALDIVCDGWNDPPMREVGRAMTIGDLSKMLEPYPDAMHVRISMPITHGDISHRMLDIVMLGHSVGTGKGVGIQIITENYDGPYQTIREYPEAVERRQAAAAPSA